MELCLKSSFFGFFCKSTLVRGTKTTEHLRGDRGAGKLLSAETYKLLHTPEFNHYACGWIRIEPVCLFLDSKKYPVIAHKTPASAPDWVRGPSGVSRTRLARIFALPFLLAPAPPCLACWP